MYNKSEREIDMDSKLKLHLQFWLPQKIETLKALDCSERQIFLLKLEKNYTECL